MTLLARTVGLLALLVSISAESYADLPVAKVTVKESGAILLDGEPSSIEQLRVRFGELRAQGGTVWYHRANPSGEPPASAAQVIQLIIDNRLPVRLAIDPDFTRFATPPEVAPPK